jgi:hypothetical protein
MKKTIALVAAWLIVLANSTFATGNITTGTTTPTTPAAPKAEIVACLKQAALTREGNLQSAFKEFSDVILVAYLTRSRAITTAYDSGKSMKEIRADLKAAFDSRRSSIKIGREAFKKARKDVWTDYKVAAKACRPEKSTEKEVSQDATTQEKSEGTAF